VTPEPPNEVGARHRASAMHAPGNPDNGNVDTATLRRSKPAPGAAACGRGWTSRAPPANSQRMSLQHFEASDPRFETDGLRSLTITTPHLLGRGDITLFVPPAARKQTNVPLVILLHGVYGSHWGWAGRGGAHRTAARLIDAGEMPPMVLAMPSDGLWGEGSGYVRHSGRDFERWIVDDVPATVALAEACVTTWSPLFLAGLSMGGFGALRLAARHPGRIRGASGHSSATHLDQLAPYLTPEMERIGPEAEEPSVLEALRRQRAVLPPFRFDCGTEDALFGENRALHAALVAEGIPHEYAEFPGGHDWAYWEIHLVDTLRFFARIVNTGRE